MVMVNKTLLSALSELHELVDLLDDNVVTLNRANIVRLCSNITYCVGDILESAIPDGYDIIIK